MYASSLLWGSIPAYLGSSSGCVPLLGKQLLTHLLDAIELLLKLLASLTLLLKLLSQLADQNSSSCA